MKTSKIKADQVKTKVVKIDDRLSITTIVKEKPVQLKKIVDKKNISKTIEKVTEKVSIKGTQNINDVISSLKGIKETKDSQIESKDIQEKKVQPVKKAVKKEEKAYIIPLGGLDEIGKNMTLIQYRDEIIVIDVGMAFPDDQLPGIDIVLPDYSYLENNKKKIKGIFITHGHEDHIGGLPYLFKKIDTDVPVYGGKLTLALAQSKFEKDGFVGSKKPKFKEVKGRSRVKVGKYFTIEYIRVTHSIADAYSLAITTPAGVIVHTGDFKIDLTPVDGEHVDFHRLAELGEKGVDILLSDSTNSEVEGYTPSERTVGEAIKVEFAKAEGRIIIASFASHVHRLQQIIDVAVSFKRKIAVDGRSMIKVFEIASKLG